MINGCLIFALIIVLSGAAVGAVRRRKNGSACCGSANAPVGKRIRPADPKRTNYAFCTAARVSGMTCANCARMIENAYNVLPDTLAAVDFSNETIEILTKYPPNVGELKRIAAQAGYSVSNIEIG